jgi:cytochrome c6
MNKLVLRISLAALVGGIFAGTVYAADAVKGKAVFEQRCIMCHAKDLKGNPMMAKVFNIDPAALNLVSKKVQDEKDADLIATTTKGKNKMPAQEGKLSPEDIANTVAYIRGSQPPAK